MDTVTDRVAAAGPSVDGDWVLDLRAFGYSILPGLVTPSQIQTLRSRLPSGVALDSSAGTAKGQEITQVFLRSWATTTVIRDIFLEPRVQWLLGHFHVQSFIEHSKLLVKAPLGPQTPWHQDHAFFRPFDPAATMLSLWLPLDRVDRENGCLEIVPGSHLQPLLEHRDAKGGEKELAAASAVSAHRTIDVELDPGDAVIFHSRLIHRAYANRTGLPRFAFKIVCQDRSRRTPGWRQHRSSVRFDGATGLLNRVVPCATARLLTEMDEMRQRGSQLRRKLRRKSQ